MTKSDGRILIYSAVCSKGTYAPLDGIPMLVNVSKKTIVGKPMSLEDVQDVTDKINKTVDVVKSLADIAGSFEDALESEASQKLLKRTVGTISGAGDIIKGIIKLIPSPEDPMVQALQDLVDSVDELEGKISTGFNQLKALITDVAFFTKIISPTLVLSSYMNDCIQFPGPDAKQNFKSLYEKHQPIQVAYSLISSLEQESTNPIKAAVNASGDKAKDTFDSWQDLICRVMGHLIIIEAFANGYLKPMDKNDCDILIDRSIEEYRKITVLRGEYEEAERNVYWSQLKEFMDNEIFPRTNWTLGQKIGVVEKKLNEITPKFIFINDGLTAGFFEGTKERDNEVTYHCQNESSQLISYWDRGYMNAFIYQSRTARNKDADGDANLQQAMNTIRDSGLRDNGSLNEMMRTQIVDKGLVKDYGFILLVRSYKNLEFCQAYKTKQEPSKRMTIQIPHVNTEPYEFIMSYN